MASFSVRIESFFGHHTFYFNLITNGSGYYFHLSYIDDHRRLQELKMTEGKNGWQLAGRKHLPAWLTDLEKEFSAYIQQHLQLQRVEKTVAR